MASKTDFHPALAVNNVKHFIPITLEMEKGQYSSWAELFKIHCRAYKVIDYIIPLKSSKKGKEQAAEVDPELWSRLHAIVLQWIYGTISNELLNTILKADTTAHRAWEHLKNIFQNNKNSRVVYLENQFTHVHLDDFSNVYAYCQELKMLADQLSNVGLNENYDGVATFIQQSDPLPPFYEARSRLILYEAGGER
ncbi:uncharacterized protein LOC119370426 [Jatropha curcas]|uniref:uncharacterized protein LOC119370425 n=1 Tax=Jatropha curcas TaxID=180498 RepID=UPI001893DB5E|nr:uncharacterized protein LOC119370425 [Jatropha curcas]XP_037494494.1 uncharacterized protein LOC119370426 [Jatropha curcas]